jgi:hypothetical protein
MKDQELIDMMSLLDLLPDKEDFSVGDIVRLNSNQRITIDGIVFKHTSKYLIIMDEPRYSYYGRANNTPDAETISLVKTNKTNHTQMPAHNGMDVITISLDSFTRYFRIYKPRSKYKSYYEKDE